MIFGNRIKCKLTQNDIKIKNNYNCNTKNIIYMIICLKCGKIYIGSTKRMAKTRMNKHEYDIIKNDGGCITVDHFNNSCCGENGDPLKYFGFKILEKIKRNNNIDTNDHLFWKRETYWQKRLLTYINGLNDRIDINSSNGHRRCHKNTQIKMINQLRYDLEIDELKQYLEINNNINNNNNHNNKSKTKTKIRNFMKHHYDKLLLKNKDYVFYFNHINIGEVALLNKCKITKNDALNSDEHNIIPSLIYGINNTHHCGICNNIDPPLNIIEKIENNNKYKTRKQKQYLNDNGFALNRMVRCDGPRLDDTTSILCNQWYHAICISGAIDHKFDDFYFGSKCKHEMWYNNLNDDCKSKVNKRLHLIRDYQEQRRNKIIH